MRTISFLLWYLAIGMCVIIITNRFFGDRWESWLLGFVIFGALAPFLPRFLERRRKLIETDETETDVESDPRVQRVLQEVNTFVENDPTIQSFLQAMSLTLEQVHAMNEAELRTIVASYHQRQATLCNDSPSGSKSYYAFLHTKGLKPGQAKALSDSVQKSLKREYRRWRNLP